jgi:hypothetical protein
VREYDDKRHSPSRSQFVTALAWFSIVIAALAMCSSLLQNIFVHVFLPNTTIEQFQQAADANVVPPALMFVFKHMKTILLVYLLMTIVLLIVSIALLKRKEWGRVAFIALLAIGTLSGFAPLFFPISVADFLPKDVAGVDPNIAADFALGFKIVLILLTLLFVALHGWIIYKLCRPEIRAEFG